jgi:hypothetical protein
MLILPTLTAQQVKDIEPEVFSEATDEYIAALANTAVLDYVRDDIADELRMSLEDDDDALQDLVDANEKLMKKAVLFKTLEIYFGARVDGEGSMTEQRYQRYQREYLGAKRRFASLNATGVTQKTTFGVVTR